MIMHMQFTFTHTHTHTHTHSDAHCPRACETHNETQCLKESVELYTTSPMMNTSDEFALKELLKNRSLWRQVTEVLIWISLLIINVIGNGLICFLMLVRRRFCDAQCCLIFSLSVSDLLLGLFVIPISLAVLISGDWPFPQGICQLQGLVVHTSIFTSVGTILLISINRYSAMFKPSLYRRLKTRRVNTLMILSVWMVSLTITVAALLPDGKGYVIIPGYACCSFKLDSKETRSILLESFTVVAVVIIVHNYTRIMIAYKRYMSVMNHEGMEQPTLSRRERNILKTLCVAIVTFLLCWVPISLLQLVDMSVHLSKVSSRDIQIIQVFLGFLSGSVNPICYGWVNDHFRREYKRIFMTILGHS